MAKQFEFEGQQYEFPDDATDDEILGLIGGAAPAQQKPQLDAAGRVGGFLTRYGVQGAVQGAAGLPALAADSAMGVGRDIAYYGKLGLSKLGATEAPDPKNYYGDGPAFPASAAVADAAQKAGKAASFGAIEPENGAERVAAAGIEGTAAALSGAGVGSFLARLGAATGSATAKGVGTFLAAEPGVQAAAGAAAGAAGAGAAESDIVREKLPEWAPGAIGMAAGIGTGAAISGARAFAGYDPVSKRYIQAGNAEGKSRLRNTILQDMADNPEAAARNLEARTAVESSPSFVFPGYKEITPNAALDPGLAKNAPTLQMYSGSDIAARMRENSGAINKAFIAEGAGEGAAQSARAQANAGALRDLPEFGLTGATAGKNEPVKINDILRDLRRRSQGTRAGTTSASRDVNAEAREALLGVAKRRRVQIGQKADGSPRYGTEYWATPERIHSVTGDLSESLKPGAPGATLPVPSAARARGETGRVKGVLDDTISSKVGPIEGPQGTELTYKDYLRRQSGLRRESDERSFMRAQLEDIGPNTDPVTGQQMIQPSRMARFFNERNADRTIPGAQSNMSINRLTPARQQFLREAEEVGQVANYQNAPGTGVRGSNTKSNDWTQKNILAQIRASQAPIERVGDTLANAPVIGKVSKVLGTVFGGSGKSRLEQTADDVQGMVGRTVTDRSAAIEALRGRTLPARGVGMSTVRGALRGSQYAAQGFLADQRRKAEKRSRYR